MDYYELMHRDLVVAVFSVNDCDEIQVMFEQDNKEHLPLGVSDRRTFIKWLKNRAIPVTRDGIEKITNNPFQTMLYNRALSLTDSYWIRFCEDSFLWDTINLYDNYFKSSMVLDIIEDLNVRDTTDFTPSSSLKGDLKKKWNITEEGDRVVLKGNYGDNALQSVSEVIASCIYKKLNICEFAEYKFALLSSNNKEILGCYSKNFTRKDLEFVPAIEVVNSCKQKNNESVYQLFIRECETKGITDVKEFMDAMLSVDFLMANTDRHFNNFGILRDPVTLEWKKMAPVFDSGNSLFFRSGKNAVLPKGRELLETEINSFYKTLIRQMSVVDFSILDLKLLPDFKELEEILKKDKSLSEIDIEQRLILMGELRDFFRDMQNGRKLWSYDELRKL